MTSLFLWLRTLAPLVFIPIVTVSVNAGNLRLQLSGIEQNGGKVYVALFNSPKDFPNPNSETRFQKIPATDSMLIVEYFDLPKGTYAVAIYQDENRNEKLDRTWIGKPKEPYGFSQNYRPRFGPPEFKKVSFLVNSQVTVLSIQVRDP